MKSWKLNVVFICVALAVVGCNTINKLDKSDEYKKVTPYDRPLVLPKDLNEGAIENRYPVPKVEDGKHHVEVSTVPPGSKLPK